MKKSVWIKGSEIRKMTNKQIANYEFNTRITNPNEPSDHELLKQLAKNQASDHELLIELIKEVKQIKIDLSNFKTEITTRLDNLVKSNNLIE